MAAAGAHGRRGSDEVNAAERLKTKTKRGGYVCLRSAIDGYSRRAYTEALEDEKLPLQSRSCTGPEHG
jgi:hypothetical protein